LVNFGIKVSHRFTHGVGWGDSQFWARNVSVPCPRNLSHILHPDIVFLHADSAGAGRRNQDDSKTAKMT